MTESMPALKKVGIVGLPESLLGWKLTLPNVDSGAFSVILAGLPCEIFANLCWRQCHESTGRMPSGPFR